MLTGVGNVKNLAPIKVTVENEPSVESLKNLAEYLTNIATR